MGIGMRNRGHEGGGRKALRQELRKSVGDKSKEMAEGHG